MPQVGDIARAKDVGVNSGYHKCVWHACVQCGAERWVLLRGGEPQSLRCYPCGRTHSIRVRPVKRGAEHWNWRGGRSVTTAGYAEVWIAASDPYAAMAGVDGYVYEHRLVMARHLGRCLERDEEVHHQNKDKQDNRIENLVLFTRSEHAFHHQDVDALMRENARLREEVARLNGLLDAHGGA